MVTPLDRIGHEVAGRYKIVKLLAEGGFAAVYEAEHLVSGMRVALKILHAEVRALENTEERFLQEARLIAAIQHPHIVRLLDAGYDDDGAAYVAFELLRGETLGQWLARVGKLPTDDAVRVIADVLRALTAAHRRGIVHRDIKPENIFLARDEDGGVTTKLIDFGIARAEPKGAKLTQTGMLLGSPNYMAPEQTQGEPATPAADLWAVGAVLYEVLTGQVAFDAPSVMLVLQKIYFDQNPSLKGRVPDAIAAVVDRALAKKPEERFPSAEAMLAALEVAGADVTDSPRPTSPGFDLDFGAVPSAPSLDDLGWSDPPPSSNAPSRPPSVSVSKPPSAIAARSSAPPAGSPSKRPSTAPEVRVVRPESRVLDAMTPEVVDRTTIPVQRRPRSISAAGALLGIVAATGGIIFAGWKVYELSRAAHAPIARASVAPPPDPDEDPDADAGVAQAADGGRRAPRPEVHTPVEFGVQHHIDLPRGTEDDARAFAAQLAALPPGLDGARRGFATCSPTTLYLHPGGLVVPLRAVPAALACQGRALAVTPDIDRDGQPDVVALDRRGGALLVVSSRGRVARRIALPGVAGVAAGVVVGRNEPAAVAFTQRRASAPAELVAVGLRSGRVAWRSARDLAPGAPEDFGLAVGPDADGDGRPDVVAGTTHDGRRCATMVSGATGATVWPAPVCSDTLGAQWLSLGPDADEDGRGDVAVGQRASRRVRVLSGRDGREILAIDGPAGPEGLAFGWPVALVPDLADDGFPDVVVGARAGDHPRVEVYSANDGHRVGARDLGRAAAGAPLGVQYVEGFAFAGGRSVVVAAPGQGVEVIGVGSTRRPRVGE